MSWPTNTLLAVIALLLFALVVQGVDEWPPIESVLLTGLLLGGPAFYFVAFGASSKIICVMNDDPFPYGWLDINWFVVAYGVWWVSWIGLSYLFGYPWLSIDFRISLFLLAITGMGGLLVATLPERYVDWVIDDLESNVSRVGFFLANVAVLVINAVGFVAVLWGGVVVERLSRTRVLEEVLDFSWWL